MKKTYVLPIAVVSAIIVAVLATCLNAQQTQPTEKAAAATATTINFGTATWNQQYMTEIAAPNFSPNYIVDLHLRINISTDVYATAAVPAPYPVSRCRDVLDGLEAASKGGKQSDVIYAMIYYAGGGVQNAPNPFGLPTSVLPNLRDIAKEVQAGTLASNWTIRAYTDYNTDHTQSGDFIEFEYRQSFGSGDANAVNEVNGDLLSSAAATADSGFNNLIKDTAARNIIGLK